jgi:DNA replication protein DnaC
MADTFGAEIAANAALCESCSNEWDQEVNARMKNRDSSRKNGLVSKLIPDLYLATDTSRFPLHPHKTTLNHKFANGTGLWIEGRSGTMKSRLAYELIRLRILDGTFHSAEIISGMAFADLVASKWSDEAQDKASATAKLARATTAKLLYIDDLDKFRATPSALNALLFILEERAKYRLPVMITTQANAGTLLQKMVEAAKTDHTEPPAIIRRLVEHTTRIVTSP